MPICLPSKSSKNPAVSDEVNTFSYGSVDSSGSFSAEMKRSTFNLLAAKVCEDNYGSVDFSSSLCAEKGSDASNTQNPVCHNDKGSVVANRVSGNYKIVGLIAGGPDNCILTSSTVTIINKYIISLENLARCFPICKERSSVDTRDHQQLLPSYYVLKLVLFLVLANIFPISCKFTVNPL